MYFLTAVRQACEDRPGCRVFYRTRTGYEGEGRLTGYGDDGMRVERRGFSGAMSLEFIRFESLEKILFDEGSIAGSPG